MCGLMTREQSVPEDEGTWAILLASEVAGKLVKSADMEEETFSSVV